MNEPKKRYSVPARILELLYTDDTFFNEVMRLKKASSSSKFPKSDEWRNDDGFNLSFALAGYSPEDITIVSGENILTVKSLGIDSIEASASIPSKSEEPFDEYVKPIRPRFHSGSISRGIARRRFQVKYLISEEFNVSESIAKMEHGLLHIFIPKKETIAKKDIQIEKGKNVFYGVGKDGN